MSIGHRLDDDELTDVSLSDLYAALGERDTPFLFGRSYRVDTSHDVPFGAGNSLDRKTKYVDRGLYQEVMDNGFAATGMEPQQIIDRWLDHEHCEKCIVDGDNPVDLYYGGHRYALRKEHEGVLAVLGHSNAATKIKTYEAVIWPGLERCYNREVKNPPRDLWCAPLIDDSDDRDKDILKTMQRLGVMDAFRRSKYETHYGISGRPCQSCRHYGPNVDVMLAHCEVVSGLVRPNRHCDFFVERSGASQNPAG